MSARIFCKNLDFICRTLSETIVISANSERIPSVIPAVCSGYPSGKGQDGFPIKNVGNDRDDRFPFPTFAPARKREDKLHGNDGGKFYHTQNSIGSLFIQCRKEFPLGFFFLKVVYFLYTVSCPQEMRGNPTILVAAR